MMSCSGEHMSPLSSDLRGLLRPPAERVYASENERFRDLALLMAGCMGDRASGL